MKKFLPKTVNNPHGFTLIELLVVVSIIAFLAVIGVAAFGNAQKQARDGRRRADVDAIAKAYESNFNAITGTYADLVATQFSSGSLPFDPSTLGNYLGNRVNTEKGFWVCATLENTQGNANIAGGIAGTSTYPTFCPSTSSPVCATANNGPLYCRSSQQSQ